MKRNFQSLMLLFSMGAFSQQEASNWYFGENAGIKFNSNGTVTALTDGQLNTDEGCASLSDANGNLLFYTDGITVYNRNHAVMSNGTGLLGNYSSSQSAIIVPKPGSSNLFYIFTLDYEANVNGFRYSVVDLNLDGNLGAVTNQKNTLIYTPSNEKISVVRHSNGIDFWVVTHAWNSNSFYSYLLSSAGLSNSPIISNVGTIIGSAPENAWGCMKISPNGKKIALASSLINCQLFDFDTITGVILNPQTLINTNGSYGVEFSPNSEVLYVSFNDPRPAKIIQFSLIEANIVASATNFTIPQTFFGTLQLGPDNKIYISQIFENKLTVINNPDTIGTGCNFQLNAIDLAGRMCLQGLPNFQSSYFFSPAIQLTNSCVGQASSFSLNTSQTVSNAIWDFGDGGTAAGLTPSHTYTSANNYTVTVTATTANGTGINTRNIVVSATPAATQPSAMAICDTNNDGFA